MLPQKWVIIATLKNPLHHSKKSTFAKAIEPL